MNTKEVLLKQHGLYPKMEIQDMVKLIYQIEFAGGHLVKDEKESLKRLITEHRFAKRCSVNKKIHHSMFEEIGNSLCRLHLAPLKTGTVNLTTVNRFFLNTADSVSGSIENFEKRLDVFVQCCKDGKLPYGLKDVKAYLNTYQRRGYPPVSHSKLYKTTYFPAYRIVKSDYRVFFEVFCKIDSLMCSQSKVNVAIDGNSGAGKSTLADLIGDVYDCNVFHMDDFFLTPELRTKERLNEVGGNVDYVRFRQEIMDELSGDREFQYQVYDCRQKAFTQTIWATPKKLNIIEGCYSMHPTLIDYYDLKLFLYIEKQEQISRILNRNGPDMLKRFLNEWIPLEDRYFQEFKIQQHSDLIFKTAGVRIS